MWINDLTWDWKTYLPRTIAEVPERVSGIYFIATGTGAAIHIGHSEDVAESIAEHFEGKSDEGECIEQHAPIKFCYWILGDEEERQWRTADLIEAFSPSCNQ